MKKPEKSEFQLVIDGEFIDPAFLMDCTAIAAEMMFDRYKAIHAASDAATLPAGQFMNEILALGILSQWKRYGIQPKTVVFSNVFPDPAFDPLMAALFTVYRAQNKSRYLTISSVREYKNVIMIDGLAEVGKSLILLEEKLQKIKKI